MRRPAALVLAALVACASCREVPRKVEPVSDTREYAALGTSYAFRSGKPDDPLEDQMAFHVEAGYVLWDGEEHVFLGLRHWRASADLGIAFSRFDIEPPINNIDEVDVYRISLGGRLERDLDGVPLTPYLRGGLFARTHGDQELDFDPFDQDARGVYAGAGLVWWFEENVGLGPFVTYARDVNTNNLVETFVGLTLLIRASE